MKTALIHLEDYELSGGGKLGESYIHRSDPDVLLKLYSTQLEQTGMEEYARACKVFRAGVPCPEPGEMVRTEDGRLGILYRRIVGKMSYARALSEHPERLEEYAESFAKVCRELHSIRPEPGVFPTAKAQYKMEMERNPFLSTEERDGLLRFIDRLPDGDTAVHGDLHHGNVIFTEDGKQYFIDLSDFCTGSPLFDLGILMLHTNWLPEETERNLYHISQDISKAFWRAFVAAYFGAGTDLEEVQRMLRPYAFLRILVTERLIGSPLDEIRPKFRAMIGL